MRRAGVEVRVRVSVFVKDGCGKGEVWVVNGDGDVKEADRGGDSGGEV